MRSRSSTATERPSSRRRAASSSTSARRVGVTLSVAEPTRITIFSTPRRLLDPQRLWRATAAAVFSLLAAPELPSTPVSPGLDQNPSALPGATGEQEAAVRARTPVGDLQLSAVRAL